MVEPVFRTPQYSKMLGMTGRLYLYGLRVAGRFYIPSLGIKKTGTVGSRATIPVLSGCKGALR
jgi:hypothetical protein